MDYVLNYMKKHGLKMTRKNYLDIAFLGNAPKELDPEVEEEIPPQVRFAHENPDEIKPVIPPTPPVSPSEIKARTGLDSISKPT